MKSFFEGLLKVVIQSSAQGVVAATSTGVAASPSTLGIVAGASALAGVLQYILAHPASQHPAVAAGVAAVTTLP